jgi:2-oxoglutarate dehydrogenase E2 component (dihydrolipoamide succinyltransferase)
VSGTLTSISAEAGADASVGDVIGTMEEGAVATAPAPTSTPAAAPATPAPAAASSTTVMPAAQRELAQRGLSAGDVQATGPGGRLLKEDVLKHQPAAPAAPAPTAAKPAPKPSAPTGAREEEVVPMSPMRKKIASRLVEAQQTAALLTTFNEVDMSAVMGLRKSHQDQFVKKYETKLGFMSFFIKAAVDALKLVPQINAEIRDNSIVYRHYADIGVAVGGGKGLVVPVIRNAERLSFADIELTIKDFGARAQKNQLQLSELQGGTFTISNGGIYGSLLSTPIINPPQSGILGLHGIKERPIAVNGEVVIRPMMYIALTYDHRIVDGKGAVTFLSRIKDCIENPARMLLEI